MDNVNQQGVSLPDDATRERSRRDLVRGIAVIPLAATAVVAGGLALLGAMIFLPALNESPTAPDYYPEGQSDALGLGAILLIAFGPVALACLVPAVLAFVPRRARAFWIVSVVVGLGPLVAAFSLEWKPIRLIAEGDLHRILVLLLVPVVFVAYQWWFSLMGYAGRWRIAT